jgi:hypothetical protein
VAAVRFAFHRAIVEISTASLLAHEAALTAGCPDPVARHVLASACDAARTHPNDDTGIAPPEPAHVLRFFEEAVYRLVCATDAVVLCRACDTRYSSTALASVAVEGAYRTMGWDELRCPRAHELLSRITYIGY